VPFLTVRVIPRASKPGLAGTRDGDLLIRLKAPPVEGAANAELIRVLSDLFDVPQRSIAIVSGAAARRKRVRIDGVTDTYIAARLASQRERSG